MDDLDPLAIEFTEEINDRDREFTTALSTATWEHEDLAQVRIKVMRGHTDSVQSCEFCAGDERILTGSHDGSVIMWSFTTGQVLKCYNSKSKHITEARANPDATKMVSSDWDKKLLHWDLETAKILWEGTHGGIVTCCRYSSDGQMVVSGSDLDYHVKVTDSRTGEVIHHIKDLHTSTVTSCMFTPSCDRLVTTSMDKTTKFWDLRTGKCTLALGGHINVIACASMTADERKMATVSWDKAIQFWDISTGMYRSQGPCSLEKAHEGSISSCRFSTDGTMLVTGGYDNSICTWDVDNVVKKLKLQGHGDWVKDVCFSSDQNWLLSCSKDTTVRLWNIKDTDKIPLVFENRKSIGLQVFKCTTCGKPFSIAEVDSPVEANLCVFCRLQTPDRQAASH